MSINKSYIKFILDNFIEDKMRVSIPEPQENDSAIRWEIGPSLFINFTIKKYESYSRSVKFTICFDKYEEEVLIYFPLNKSPNELLNRIYNRFSSRIYKTFIDDNRKDYIIQQYKEVRSKMFSNLKLNDLKLTENE